MSNSNSNKIPPYLNHRLPINERVCDLISRMTLEEKISQLLNISLGIDRLKIPYYDWRNECNHGVAFAGKATVFPQVIGLAATWNTELIYKIATAISDEARAKHHEAIKNSFRRRYYGLTFSAPNINIFRDPRWGRGQETYGEDPYLASKMAISYINGLQGNDPNYIKVIATAKHFAVHSGPEKERHKININISKKDLYETYLPAFKASIQKAHAGAIMGAYNRLFGDACCASTFLLKEILRNKWGFKGYVISDGGAITDIYKNHKIVDNFSEAAALAINAGCDILNPLNLMTKTKVKKFQAHVLNAVKNNLLKEETIDRTLKRTLIARFKLGMFDPPELVPFTKYPLDVVNCEKHQNLALQAARESIVLLKNENHLLPLRKNYKSIAIIGPNANNLDALIGNYYGEPFNYITPLQGIKEKLLQKTKILYSLGCELDDNKKDKINEAINIAEKSEIIIMVLGLTGKIEGEEGDVVGPTRGDRVDLNLPGIQEKLLEKINKLGKKIVLLLMNGSAISINYAQREIPAIIEAWYPGEQGGRAIADVLFGDFNPSGRLPITFYNGIEQLPDFLDYSMENRTYRYLKQKPLYPFGYGLSFTSFKYSNLKIIPQKVKPKDIVTVSVEIENSGNYDGFEIIQLYLKKLSSSTTLPIRELKGFKKIYLKKNKKLTVSFKLTHKNYSIIIDDGVSTIEQGEFLVSVGGSQPDYKNDQDMLYGKFELI